MVLDLRVGSPTYGSCASVVLDGEKGNMLSIPVGLAHGFRVTSDTAVMMYKVSTVYSSAHDTGVLWNSAGFEWGDESPVISERDASFPPLSQFQSPFVFQEQ